MGQVRKNELAALGLISRQPMHGYRLNQAIQEMELERWTTLSRSSIYHALRELARSGAVSVTREREGRAPERTVYHITPDGKRVLREILREALSYVGPEDRFFYLGLAFARILPAGEIAALLSKRCRHLQAVIAEETRLLKEKGRKAVEAGPEPERQRSLIMTRGGLKHLKVEVEVCREVGKLLGADPGARGAGGNGRAAAGRRG